MPAELRVRDERERCGSGFQRTALALAASSIRPSDLIECPWIAAVIYVESGADGL